MGSPGRADSHVPHVSGRRVAHVTFVAFPTVFPTRSRGDQPPRSRRSRGLWSAFHVSDVRHQKGGSPGGALASLPTPAHVDHVDHVGGWPPSRLAWLAPLTWITWITWGVTTSRRAWLAPLTWSTWITWAAGAFFAGTRGARGACGAPGSRVCNQPPPSSSDAGCCDSAITVRGTEATRALIIAASLGLALAPGAARH